ncbi:MAG TPA: sugar phosphate nucleotidyltransferase [Acidobacteriota bacterium]|nr:sugar phosphate nucleotidyltransferase [Acidobacteriota bacterium]
MIDRRRYKTAFILGAGLGTRLRPLTELRPKPLLDIGGRPAVTYAMDHLLTAGIRRFIINAHHHPEAYLQTFPERNWRGIPIILRYEPLLLDTAGGLKNIEDLLEEDDAIVCYNGDIIADFPLDKLIRSHELTRPLATLALRSNGPILNVSVNGLNEICDIRDVIGNPGVKRYGFTGIYIIESSILRHIEPCVPTSIITTFINLISDRPGSVMASVIDEGDWLDMGSIEAYERMKTGISPTESR